MALWPEGPALAELECPVYTASISVRCVVPEESPVGIESGLEGVDGGSAYNLGR